VQPIVITSGGEEGFVVGYSFLAVDDGTGDEAKGGF
jgi:hypothetical protein